MGDMNPGVLALIVGGIILNLVVSTGALWKLVEFARIFGSVETAVKTHENEITNLRHFADEVREGRFAPRTDKH